MEQMHQVEDSENGVRPYRTFEVTYKDNTSELFAAHGFDVVQGHAVFFDRQETPTGDEIRLYRGAAPSGLWRLVREVSAQIGTTVNALLLAVLPVIDLVC